MTAERKMIYLDDAIATFEGWGLRHPSGMPADDDVAAALRALPAVAPAVKVKPLVWDRDGRKLRFDDTMHMSKSYDWDTYECLRQEGYGLDSGYIIWPEGVGATVWNVYGTYDGLYIQGLADETAAKAAAQADYAARILAALPKEGE